MNCKTIFFLMLFLSFNYCGFAMGEKIAIKPLTLKDIRINDEELLIFAVYKGNELTGYNHCVTRYDTNTGIASLYTDFEPIDGSIRLPGHYTNYSEYDEVDTVKGTQLFYRRSFLDRYLLLRKKGVVYVETCFDYTNNIISSREQVWDGFEMRNKKSTIAMKPGFQHWNMEPYNAMINIGLRIIDFKSGGVVYGVMPSIIKETVPGNLRFIKREEIKTKAGVFKTIKVSFQISDPFLGKLMESFTRELFLWIEDSPRALLIKDQEPDGWSIVLEQITSWPQK